MFKKILSLGLVLILSAFCYVPSFAEDIDVPADEPLNTEFQHIDTIVTDLKINGGTAYVGVQVIGIINHTTKIEVTATLQKKSGTKWNNVKTWNKTENNYLLRLNKTKAVNKGTYRVKNVVRAYKNSNVETTTDYSGTITFN